jgi:hypothetical protein
MAFAVVDVSGADHAMELQLGPGMSLSGRFVFEGGAQPESLAGSQITLAGFQISPGLTVDIFRADASADGTFLAGGLSPGRYLVTATAPGSTPTSGFALKSIVRDGRDLLDSPFELAPGDILTDVVITFTARPAELTGALLDPAGTPVTDYFIIVFSTDSRFWFPSSRRIVAVRPNSAGVYSIRNPPPGEYFLSAVTDVEVGEWFDSGFLNALMASSPLKITISEGEVKRQDLRIK